MSNVALNREGQFVLADIMLDADWQALKKGYAIGDFTMPCCPSPAILKSSSNGLPFFAHQGDECATAPETKWHREAKALIAATVADLGLTCREEVPGGYQEALWQADTYFEVGHRRIVIELQRSYQHLNDYLRRQKRYVQAEIESYWLVRPEVFVGLARALTKFRTKRDFGGKFPEAGFFPLIKELPVAVLDTADLPVIRSVKLFHAPLRDWLLAIIDQRFRWDEDGAWVIL